MDWHYGLVLRPHSRRCLPLTGTHQPIRDSRSVLHRTPDSIRLALLQDCIGRHSCLRTWAHRLRFKNEGWGTRYFVIEMEIKDRGTCPETKLRKPLRRMHPRGYAGHERRVHVPPQQ